MKSSGLMISHEQASSVYSKIENGFCFIPPKYEYITVKVVVSLCQVLSISTVMQLFRALYFHATLII